MKKLINKFANFLLLLFFAFLFVSPQLTVAQTYKVNVTAMPLNEVFISLRNIYPLSFSYDDTYLKNFTITAHKTFSTPEEMISFLLNNLPLEYEKSGNTYVIYPKQQNTAIQAITPNPPPKIYKISGKVIEEKTGEALPFSYVTVNSHLMVTDEGGRFSFASAIDSIFNITISHIGYQLFQTISYVGMNQKFEMKPETTEINEVVVNDNIITNFSTTGNEAGLTKLNHRICKFLPGSSDNSVFNLLRLQAGILASGEQTNDLIIWGAYPGQSRILFEGAVVFGLKNFNDNISSINPLIVKNIEVHKAAYDASHGDCVGGIAQITGKDGGFDKKTVELGVNNYTINGLINIPFKSVSALQIAFRKSYYNLYEPENFLLPSMQKDSSSQGNGQSQSLVDVFVEPDYSFQDWNVKFHQKMKSGGYFSASFLHGNDNFSYQLEKERMHSVITINSAEKNSQNIFSSSMAHNFRNGAANIFSLSFSELQTESSYLYKITGNGNHNIVHNLLQNEMVNSINEFNATNNYSLPLNEYNIIEGGISLINNKIELSIDTNNVNSDLLELSENYMVFFLQENISFRKTNIKIGLRNIFHQEGFSFFEPRISVSHRFNEKWKINAAAGKYTQFTTKISVIDELGNYRYLWALCNNNLIKVPVSQHYVAGISRTTNNLTLSVEGYYKFTRGLSRYQNNFDVANIFNGKSKSYGIDIYTKLNWRNHSFWASYSLSETLEHFQYFQTPNYRRAAHDQRHEWKGALLLNFEPFYFSANYVYGSGFPAFAHAATLPIDTETPYNRLDVAGVYKFSIKNISFETGLSILNVFNSENIKFANFERVKTNQGEALNLYSDAMPFTPTIFLKINF